MAQAKAGALNDLNTEIVASLDDFQDPSQEWRRLFSELLGTFFLVLVAAGGGMMGQAFPGTISRAAAVVAPGLMVMAIILFMGKVSGAHLNPAVSIAFSLRGDFPWRRVPGYIVVQLIGATLAALFLHAVINVSARYGSNYPASGYSASDAFLMEAVLTLGLVSVILGTASGAQTEVLNSKSAPQALVEQGSSFSAAGTAFTAAPGNREPRSNRALFVSRGRSRRTCF
jgi:aquaporin Z